MKTIEYPIKDMVSFRYMGKGKWRLNCHLYQSQREYLYEDISTRKLKKRWGELDHQINKFIDEVGIFKITYESYFPEYWLPMVVFTNPDFQLMSKVA